jgi:hypothetical protein
MNNQVNLNAGAAGAKKVRAESSDYTDRIAVKNAQGI